MTHGSLFSGIGGFDLAAEWMGWENIFHCEWNEFGQKILNYYWPKAKSYGDITTTDFTVHRGQIDILTGGFPCQPYSSAGKRLGKEDDRHLWPEMLRAVREIRPKWVVGENVLGIVNWNGGLVFDEVQADLEAQGYQIQPYVLPAVSVNAPHRRDRVWFVAFNPDRPTSGKKRNLGRNDGKGVSGAAKKGVLQKENNKCSGLGEIPSEERIVADTKGSSSEGECQCGQGEGKSRGCDCKTIANTPCKRRNWEIIWQRNRKSNESYKNGSANDWKDFPTKPPICGGNDGIPRELDAITFPKWRNESIKAYGNAIVPQIALMIFKSIEKYEEMQSV